jgi:RNA polymerase sigma-70 factor (ECF subfamily)
MDLTSKRDGACSSVGWCVDCGDESSPPHDGLELVSEGAKPARATPRAAAPAMAEEQLAALVLRLCDQHEPSLARLYEATARRVYALVQRIVNAAPLAEEVVEDVFWRAWREAPRFDPERGNVLVLLCH